MKKLLLSYFLSLLIPLLGMGQDRRFSKADIAADLSCLRTSLLEKHPNLEIYTDREEFERFFEEIEIPDSLSETEAYGLIASSNQVIQDGHTLFYPAKKSLEARRKSGKYLPIQTYWDGKGLFLRKAWQNLPKLKTGAEIISINGRKSQELIGEMLGKMMRDGKNYQYPVWVLNQYFYEYHNYFYGSSDTYTLQLRGKEGIESVKLKASSKEELLANLRAERKADERGISLELNPENNWAMLRIRDWHKEVLKKIFKQNFKKEIRSAIQEIEENQVEHLIIDLRDNQGGNTQYSRYLLSYLLEESFVLVESYQKKKKGKLSGSKGPQMGIHQVLPKTFAGKVYVLINGGSFSNSGIFCSILKAHNRAYFIGEETGGSEFVICGASKNMELPHTGIQVVLPQLQFQIKAYQKEDLHGVKPDLTIMPSIENLIEDRDVALERTLDLIEGQRSQ